MMKSSLLQGLTVFFLVTFLFVGPGLARPKPWSGGWWNYEQNFAAVIPHKSGSKHFHPHQWQSRDIKLSYEEREKTIERLKEYGFIHSLTATPQTATVWTGPMFDDLSYPDQLYIMDIIAWHYDILNSDYEMFFIRQAKNGRFWGSYTKYGLQVE